jgi:hypothetical protein
MRCYVAHGMAGLPSPPTAFIRTPRRTKVRRGALITLDFLCYRQNLHADEQCVTDSCQ